MRNFIKVAVTTILLSLLAANLGIELAPVFAIHPNGFDPIGQAINQVAKNPIAQSIGNWVSNSGATNWLLVFVGFGQLAMIGWQAAIADRQRTLMTGQLEAAKIAAEATRGQLAHFEIVGSPFLFPIVEADFSRYLKQLLNLSPERLLAQHIPPPQVSIRFHNYGKTPAIIRDAFAVVLVHKDPTDVVLGYHNINLPAEVVVGPDKTTENLWGHISALMRIRTHEDVQAIMRGDSFFWVKGWINYYDVFGELWSYRFSWRHDESFQRFAPWPWEKNYAEKHEHKPHHPRDAAPS